MLNIKNLNDQKINNYNTFNAEKIVIDFLKQGVFENEKSLNDETIEKKYQEKGLNYDSRHFLIDKNGITENHITCHLDNDKNSSLILRFICHTNPRNEIYDWELKLIDENKTVQTRNSDGDYKIQLFDKNGYKIFEENGSINKTTYIEKFLRNENGKEIWYKNSNDVVYLNGKEDYTRIETKESKQLEKNWNDLIKDLDFKEIVESAEELEFEENFDNIENEF